MKYEVCAVCNKLYTRMLHCCRVSCLLMMECIVIMLLSCC